MHWVYNIMYIVFSYRHTIVSLSSLNSDPFLTIYLPFMCDFAFECPIILVTYYVDQALKLASHE